MTSPRYFLNKPWHWKHTWDIGIRSVLKFYYPYYELIMKSWVHITSTLKWVFVKHSAWDVIDVRDEGKSCNCCAKARPRRPIPILKAGIQDAWQAARKHLSNVRSTAGQPQPARASGLRCQKLRVNGNFTSLQSDGNRVLPCDLHINTGLSLDRLAQWTCRPERWVTGRTCMQPLPSSQAGHTLLVFGCDMGQ